jgi:glucosylceramidase
MFALKNISILFLAMQFAGGWGCQKKSVGVNGNDPGIPLPPSEVSFWLTKSDQSVLLQQQSAPIYFGTQNNSYPAIDVDSSQRFQSIDGFGYTLTGGSADLIMALPNGTRHELLRELFGQGNESIGISYLRISIGASDLNSVVYSYNDLPSGEKDITLEKFSLSLDTIHLIPLLKEILSISPQLKILGSPWSAPAWMKDNQNSKGGSLLPVYYPVYAQYFVKYLKAMKLHGIKLDAITIQNEPLHGGNNPSMVMTAGQQAIFIKDHLGPAFHAAGLDVKIIVWDHNCDRPDYPLEVLNDATAKSFVDGSAFHLYEGDISALSQVRQAHPDKHIYFTEQYTPSNGNFSSDLRWHMKNVVIGSMRNWSRNALEWNLANDPGFGPHTPGGCTVCKGALTISGINITRNVAYYIIAHASKFVHPGSVRIGSNLSGSLHNAAFQRPDGKKLLIVVNDSSSPQTFTIKFNRKWFTATLEGGSVGTFVW